MDNINLDTQIEDQKKEEFQKNAAEFNKELVTLQEKFGVVLVPIIQMSKHGMLPSLEIMDKKMFDLKTSNAAKN